MKASFQKDLNLDFYFGLPIVTPGHHVVDHLDAHGAFQSERSSALKHTEKNATDKQAILNFQNSEFMFLVTGRFWAPVCPTTMPENWSEDTGVPHLQGNSPP